MLLSFFCGTILCGGAGEAPLAKAASDQLPTLSLSSWIHHVRDGGPLAFRRRIVKFECAHAGGGSKSLTDGFFKFELVAEGVLVEELDVELNAGLSSTPRVIEYTTLYSFHSGEQAQRMTFLGRGRDSLTIDYWKELPDVLYLAVASTGPNVTEGPPPALNECVELGPNKVEKRFVVDGGATWKLRYGGENSNTLERARLDTPGVDVTVDFVGRDPSGKPALIVIDLQDDHGCSTEVQVWQRMHGGWAEEPVRDAVAAGADLQDVRSDRAQGVPVRLDRTLPLAAALVQPWGEDASTVARAESAGSLEPSPDARSPGASRRAWVSLALVAAVCAIAWMRRSRRSVALLAAFASAGAMARASSQSQDWLPALERAGVVWLADVGGGKAVRHGMRCVGRFEIDAEGVQPAAGAALWFAPATGPANTIAPTSQLPATESAQRAVEASRPSWSAFVATWSTAEYAIAEGAARFDGRVDRSTASGKLELVARFDAAPIVHFGPACGLTVRSPLPAAPDSTGRLELQLEWDLHQWRDPGGIALILRTASGARVTCPVSDSRASSAIQLKPEDETGRRLRVEAADVRDASIVETSPCSRAQIVHDRDGSFVVEVEPTRAADWPHDCARVVIAARLGDDARPHQAVVPIAHHASWSDRAGAAAMSGVFLQGETVLVLRRGEHDWRLAYPDRMPSTSDLLVQSGYAEVGRFQASNLKEVQRVEGTAFPHWSVSGVCEPRIGTLMERWWLISM